MMVEPASASRISHRRLRSFLRRIAIGVLLIVAVALFLLRFGGELLVSSDPLPSHADVAVILQGSMAGSRARVAGAVRLLQQGIPAQAALSVPAVTYWGNAAAQEAHSYIEQMYGPAIGGRFVFCQTGPEVNSTLEEAEALLPCIRQHGWQTVIVVTSDYHSRRAGFLWRQAVRKSGMPIRLWVDGVPDPEFQARGWWQKRIYAKTWYEEFSKLVIERIFE